LDVAIVPPHLFGAVDRAMDDPGADVLVVAAYVEQFGEHPHGEVMLHLALVVVVAVLPAGRAGSGRAR
jgi:hypothetical protein